MNATSAEMMGEHMDTDNKSTQDQAGTTQSQSEARFTQADVDRILSERLERQKETVTKSLLEKLGVESLDTAASALKQVKEKEIANLSEVERLRRENDDLASKNKAHVTQIETMQRQRLVDGRDRAIKSALTAARASNSDRVFTLLIADRAAEVEAAMKETGEVDATKIDALVKSAQKEYAEYFRVTSPGSPSNATGTPPSADQERIKAALAQQKRISF